MKLRAKIPVVIITLLTILYSGGYIFMFVRGRGLILDKITALTGKKASMGYFTITTPFNLEIKNLKIEGLANIESVFLSPSIPNLIAGKLALNRVRLIRPQVTYERKTPVSSTPA